MNTFMVAPLILLVGLNSYRFSSDKPKLILSQLISFSYCCKAEALPFKHWVIEVRITRRLLLFDMCQIDWFLDRLDEA